MVAWCSLAAVGPANCSTCCGHLLALGPRLAPMARTLRQGWRRRQDWHFRNGFQVFALALAGKVPLGFLHEVLVVKRALRPRRARRPGWFMLACLMIGHCCCGRLLALVLRVCHAKW